MVLNNRGNMHAGIIRMVALSLLLVFSSSSYASHDELQKIRDEIRAMGKHWTADENEISRLPDNERKMRLGLLRQESAPPVKSAGPEESPALTVAPASFDWRNYNGGSYVTGVRDQGNCGSCWAFATTAALESNVLITTGVDSDLSEQLLVSCGGSGGCGGGYITSASDFIRDTGLPPESYYPYLAKNSKCRSALAEWENVTSNITSWHYVGNTINPTVAQIKDELVNYGPLVTTFDVYSDFYYYGGGIYQYTYGTYQGGHAVLIVGYDDAGQYFIVKNSWGNSWGEAGYFRIGYSELNSVTYFGDYSLAYYTDMTPPVITVTYPDSAGIRLKRNTTQTIRWSYTGNPGAFMKIELLRADVPVSVISSGTRISEKSYTWKISAKQATGSDYKIRVTSTKNGEYTDSSDNSFTIY